MNTDENIKDHSLSFLTFLRVPHIFVFSLCHVHLKSWTALALFFLQIILENSHILHSAKFDQILEMIIGKYRRKHPTDTRLSSLLLCLSTLQHIYAYQHKINDTKNWYFILDILMERNNIHIIDFMTLK